MSDPLLARLVNLVFEFRTPFMGGFRYSSGSTGPGGVLKKTGRLIPS